MSTPGSVGVVRSSQIFPLQPIEVSLTGPDPRVKRRSPGLNWSGPEGLRLPFMFPQPSFLVGRRPGRDVLRRSGANRGKAKRRVGVGSRGVLLLDSYEE